MHTVRHVLAIAAVLGVLVFAPTCWMAADLDLGNSRRGADVAAIATPDPGEIERLTVTPVIAPDGLIERFFPDGDGLDRAPVLDKAIEEAVRVAGLSGHIPGLRLEMARFSNPDSMSGAEHYPYVFPGLDRLFGAAVNRQLYQAHRDDLVELASVMILTAAHMPEQGTPLLRHPAQAAYSLLKRLRALVPASCQVQLNLQLLVTADYAEKDEAAEAEGLRAAAVCPGDPSPLWLLGQIQVSAACGRCRLERDLRPAQSAALRTFARMDRQFPGTAWGSAGRGEYWLELAEQGEELQTQQFLTRSHYQRALDAFREAATRSRDPAVNLGIARALDGLGLHDEAFREARRVVERHPRLARAEAHYLRILQRGRRFREAAAVVERQPEVTRPTGLHLIATARGLSPKVPVSMGLIESDPVWVPLGFGGKGAASVADTRFIPTYRRGEEAAVLGPCRQVGYVRDLIIIGRHADALRAARADPNLYHDNAGRSCFDGSLGRVDESLSSVSDWRALAALDEGDPDYARWLDLADGSASESDAELSLAEAKSLLNEARQNLWRFAGDLRKAQDAAKRWRAEAPKDPVAVDRLGEIQFLRGDHAAAMTSFDQARKLYELREHTDPEDFLGSDRKHPHDAAFLARLKLGASQAGFGDVNGAARTFEGLIDDLGRALTSDVDFEDETLYLALSVAGHLALANDDHEGAARHYARASVYGASALTDDSTARTGVVENNQALAYARSGRAVAAVSQATRALHIDPANPVFVETLAFARRVAGEPGAALATYDAALELDRSLFPAHNNRGVLLAHLGRRDEAAESFRRALSVKPDYGAAWFNLGSLVSDQGGLHGLVVGQGALGRAVVADQAYRDQDPELLYDDSIYRSGLDLSRPLPTGWEFSTTAEPPIRGLAVMTMLTAALTLGRALGLDQLGNWIATRVLTRNDQDRLPWWHRLLAYRPPVVALMASAITTGVLVWREVGDLDLKALFLAAGTVILVLLVMSARRLTSFALGVRLQHLAWTPSVLLGPALAVVPIPFVPQPVARLADGSAASRVRWAGPIALTAVTALLLASGYVFGVPLTRELGVIAVALLATMLVPVRPMDGGFILRRPTGIIVSIGLLMVSAATVLAWI